MQLASTRKQALLVIMFGLLCRPCETDEKNPTTTMLNHTKINTTRKPLDYSMRPHHVAAFIESIIGILANGLLLVVLIKDPLRNLHSRNAVTIGNLAFADFWTSVTTIPFCFPSVAEYGDKASIITANVFLYVGYYSSFFLLLLFAIERYIAVSRPLRSRDILTKKKIAGACAVCWTVAVIISSLMFLEFTDILVYPDAASWLYIGMIVVLEVVAVLLVTLKIVIIYRLHKASSEGVIQVDRAKQKKEITITLVVLIVVVLVTAMPYFIAKQLEFFRRIFRNSFGKTFRRLPYKLFPLACLNFLVNPFIYAWRLPEYRNSCVALFRRNVKGTRTVSQDCKTNDATMLSQLE